MKSCSNQDSITPEPLKTATSHEATGQVGDYPEWEDATFTTVRPSSTPPVHNPSLLLLLPLTPPARSISLFMFGLVIRGARVRASHAVIGLDLLPSYIRLSNHSKASRPQFVTFSSPPSHRLPFEHSACRNFKS